MLINPLDVPLTATTGTEASRLAKGSGQPYGHVFVKATTGAAAIRDHLNEGIEDDNRDPDGRCTHCCARKM